MQEEQDRKEEEKEEAEEEEKEDEQRPHAEVVAGELSPGSKHDVHRCLQQSLEQRQDPEQEQVLEDHPQL